MNLVLEKERLAKEIEKVGGLWCSKEAAENYLKKLKTEKEKKSVLKIQLGFRQKVLGVDCDKSLFFLSSKGVVKTSDELLCNLVQIISVTCANDPGEVQNYSLPLIINKEKFQLQKDKIINKNNKRNALPSNDFEVKKKKCVVKPVVFSGSGKKDKIPVIATPDDLIGKLVFHFCIVSDSVDEDEDWHRGVVVDRQGRGNFLIRYDERQDTLFTRKLFSDFSNDKLRAASISPDDFICSTIKHKYNDAVTKEDTWWDAEVIDVDIESKDKENPNFFILYKESADDIVDLANVNDDDYFLEPLINDYLNGWVKIVSVDTDPIKF